LDENGGGGGRKETNAKKFNAPFDRQMKKGERKNKEKQQIVPISQLGGELRTFHLSSSH